MKKPKRYRLQDYKKHGFTQAGLAEKTGVGQGLICVLAKTDRPIYIEVEDEETRIIDCEPRVFGRIRNKAS